MSALSMKHFSAVDFMQRLKKANFTDEQAEVLAKETEDMFSNVIEQAKAEFDNKDLATKGDILQIKGDIRESELRLQKEIALIESKLIKWILGTGIGAILAIAGLLKFMIH